MEIDASYVRRFFDEIAPKQADSAVRVAKEVFRCSSMIAWAALGAVIVLGAGGPLGTELSRSLTTSS